MGYRVSNPRSKLNGQIRQNSLLYGRPGVGKTVLAATASNPVILCTDPGGTDSLLNHPTLRGTPTIDANDWTVAVEVIDAWVRNAKDLQGFTTFVLDTISTGQTFDLYNLRQDQGSREKASMNEWALTNQRMTDAFIKLLTKSNRPVIVVAHSKEIWQPDKQNVGDKVLLRVEPAMTPGAWESAQRLFSAIYYYRIAGIVQGATRRQLHTRAGTTKAVTKVRLGMPEVFDNPKWTDIENAHAKFLDMVKTEEGIQ